MQVKLVQDDVPLTLQLYSSRVTTGDGRMAITALVFTKPWVLDNIHSAFPSLLHVLYLLR